jgi:hypothetical protein
VYKKIARVILPLLALIIIAALTIGADSECILDRLMPPT